MTEQDLNSLKIDKTKWKPVKFGQVVFEPKENAKDFLAEGIERVVGLEHIESENIHLTNSASAQEGTTFTKKFSIDDVLFGRRRAYLKKAAQAKFSGVCSGDIIVMRAQKDKLMPELLPFIVNNDKFFDYAITHSAGGLSPRVKFKDLANYEFLLPPKEQQADLAELLWAMDEVLQKQEKLVSKLKTQRKTYLNSNLYKYKPGLNLDLPIGYTVKRLDEIAVISGGSTPSRKKDEYWNGEIPWLTPTDVTRHDDIYLKETSEYITEAGLKNISNNLYPIGSVLYCSRATIGFAVINQVEMATNQGFSNFIPRGNVSSIFLYFLLEHITPELTRLAVGSTFLEISKSAIRSFKVVIPSVEIMKKIEEDLMLIEKTHKEVNRTHSKTIHLQKSLINQVF